MGTNEAHLLFEQSGTFKNEFKKLGWNAYDYDILDDFGETDFKVDLYREIEDAYDKKRETIFDRFGKDALVMAFFPCVRFEWQITLTFRGEGRGLKKRPMEEKLERDLELFRELAKNYEIVTKLALLAMRNGFQLIIENPYSKTHVLTRYWALKPKVIDYNRRDRGDWFEKPTQYWFVNREPSNNFIFESPEEKPLKRVAHAKSQVERSMISPEYTNRSIREFIL